MEQKGSYPMAEFERAFYDGGEKIKPQLPESIAGIPIEKITPDDIEKVAEIDVDKATRMLDAYTRLRAGER